MTTAERKGENAPSKRAKLTVLKTKENIHISPLTDDADLSSDADTQSPKKYWNIPCQCISGAVLAKRDSERRMHMDVARNCREVDLSLGHSNFCGIFIPKGFSVSCSSATIRGIRISGRSIKRVLCFWQHSETLIKLERGARRHEIFAKCSQG
jgi:hypothetical protein